MCRYECTGLDIYNKDANVFINTWLSSDLTLKCFLLLARGPTTFVVCVRLTTLKGSDGF